MAQGGNVTAELAKLGLIHEVRLERAEIEEIFREHYGKGFIHVSSIVADTLGNIDSLLLPRQAPPYFKLHTPGGKKVVPGISFAEIVGQSIIAPLLKVNPDLAFLLREPSAVLKGTIMHDDKIHTRVKIEEIKRKGHLVILQATASISKYLEEKPAVNVTIKGIGEDRRG